MKINLPKRSKRFGVGKEIGGAVYVHRDYVHVLPQEAYQKARALIPGGLDFVVVKHTIKTGAFTFIRSPDFDTAHEPTVGDMIICIPDEKSPMGFKTKVLWHSEYDPLIYHHKWLFVADDYQGFNVEESKNRSRAWLALTDVDKSRIGRSSYWETYVVPKITD